MNAFSNLKITSYPFKKKNNSPKIEVKFKILKMKLRGFKIKLNQFSLLRRKVERFKIEHSFFENNLHVFTIIEIRTIFFSAMPCFLNPMYLKHIF